MGRQRISAIDPVSGGIAICFAAGAAVYAPLAAQESRLVLAESGTPLVVVAVLTAAAELSARGRRDTLVAVSRLAVPDSVPLTELLSPWRLGMLGRDTLWVADARCRVNFYDASTGESLADLSGGRSGAGGARRARALPAG
jgi:hypothetical protein